MRGAFDTYKSHAREPVSAKTASAYKLSTWKGNNPVTRIHARKQSGLQLCKSSGNSFWILMYNRDTHSYFFHHINIQQGDHPTTTRTSFGFFMWGAKTTQKCTTKHNNTGHLWPTVPHRLGTNVRYKRSKMSLKAKAWQHGLLIARFIFDVVSLGFCHRLCVSEDIWCRTVQKMVRYTGSIRNGHLPVPSPMPASCVESRIICSRQQSIAYGQPTSLCF